MIGGWLRNRIGASTERLRENRERVRSLLSQRMANCSGPCLVLYQSNESASIPRKSSAQSRERQVGQLGSRPATTMP
jgi:hypothetical protein